MIARLPWARAVLVRLILTVCPVLLVCARAEVAWAQTITIIGVYPSNPQQAQLISLAFGTTGVSISQCGLTLTAQGYPNVLLHLQAPDFPLAYRVVFYLPPFLVPGPYTFQAQCPGGIVSNSVTMNVVDGPPTVTQIDPSQTAPGVAATMVISGRGFGLTQSGGSVLLSGVGVPNISVTQVMSWSDLQIIFEIPSSAPPGSYAVQVQTSAGIYSSPAFWLAIRNQAPKPTLDYIRFPGQTLGTEQAILAFFTLSGPTYTVGQTWQQVYNNALSMAPGVNLSATATVNDMHTAVGVWLSFTDTDNKTEFPWGSYSAGGPLDAPLLVGNKGFYHVSAQEFLDCWPDNTWGPPQNPAPLPIVSGVCPTTTPGAGGSVNIIGSGFTNATEVDFGGTPATQLHVLNDSMITATIPPGTGTVDVTVTVSTNTASGRQPEKSASTPADQFTYNSNPYVLGPDGQYGIWTTLGTTSTSLYGPTATGCGTTDFTCQGSDSLQPGQGTQATCDANGTAPAGQANQAVASGATVTQTLCIPVTLLNVSSINYLRIEFSGYEGDTRPWRVFQSKYNWCGVIPNSPGSNFDTGVAWGGGSVNSYTFDNRGCVKQTVKINKTAGNFGYVVDSPVLSVQVIPVSSGTTKAVPYAIQYTPPGNSSYTKWVNAVTEGTQYQVSVASGSSNAQADVAGTCNSSSIAIKAGVFGVGGSLSDSEKSCNSTTTTLSASQSNQQAAKDYHAEMLGSGSNQTPPNTAYKPGDYTLEAFWLDYFDFLLDQPYAFYDNNGLSVAQIIPTPPVWGSSTVALLLACATGASLPGYTNNQAGILAANTALPRDVCGVGFDQNNKAILLTPRQAHTVLTLDPFYPGGQSIDPSNGGTSMRFSPLCQVGIQTCFPKSDPNGSACQPSIGNVVSNSQGQGSSGSVTTGVTINDTNSEENGMSLNLTAQWGPLTGGLTFSSTTTNTTGTSNSSGAQINYSSSTLTSSSTSVTLTPNIQDSTYAIEINPQNTACPAPFNHSPACVQNNPLVIIPFQDSTFSSLLFQDPCAPGPPPPLGPWPPLRPGHPLIWERGLFERVVKSNRALPAETAAHIAEMEQLRKLTLPVPSPKAELRPETGLRGTEFVVNWTGFAPNSTLTTHLRKPNGIELPVQHIRTDNHGSARTSIESTKLAPGEYTLWAVDDRTRRGTSHQVLEVVEKPH